MSESTITLSVPGHAPVTMTETQFRASVARVTRRKMEAEMGDNTGTSVAADQLKTIVERIERLEEEKAGTVQDIKDVYQEARVNGFETKALRKIVRIRRMDASQKAAHDETESILDTYMQALGML